MVGANPKFQTYDRAPPASGSTRFPAGVVHAGFFRRRLSAAAFLFLPLSLMLVQCSRAPNPGTLATNAAGSTGDMFDDRFPAPQFRDRFPTAKESFEQRQRSDFAPKGTAQPQTASYQVASLAPQVPVQRPAR